MTILLSLAESLVRGVIVWYREERQQSLKHTGNKFSAPEMREPFHDVFGCLYKINIKRFIFLLARLLLRYKTIGEIYLLSGRGRARKQGRSIVK